MEKRRRKDEERRRRKEKEEREKRVNERRGTIHIGLHNNNIWQIKSKAKSENGKSNMIKKLCKTAQGFYVCI